MSKNMRTRIISGIFLFLITLICNMIGGLLLLTVLLFFSLVGLLEFYRAVGVLEDGKKINLITIPGYVCTIVLYIFAFFGNNHLLQLFIIVTLIVLTMAVYVFSFPKYEAGQIAYAIFGFAYVPVMLSFIYYVRNMEYGIYTVWLIYIVSWVCDTFAYFTGMAFGKHRLAPVLSPKKSIEGAIGGVAGSILTGFLFAKFIMPTDSKIVVEVMIACAICSVVSQIGDLAASAIKRNNDIKDYGKIIPGHGGILDRFDSVIFTAPMVYFLLVFLTQNGII